MKVVMVSETASVRDEIHARLEADGFKPCELCKLVYTANRVVHVQLHATTKAVVADVIPMCTICTPIFLEVFGGES